MKNSASAVCTVLLFSFLFWPIAEVRASEANRYYVAASLGVADADFEFDAASELSDQAGIYQFQFGVLFGRHLAAETSLSLLAPLNDDIILFDRNPHVIAGAEVDIKVLDVSIVLRQPIGEAVSLWAKLGLSRWWADRSLGSENLGETAGNGLSAAVGLEFNLTQSLALSCGYRQMPIGDDQLVMRSWATGLAFSF